MPQQAADKLGISFHRSLPCRRAGIIQLLNIAANAEGELDYQEIWEKTSLGTVDAQATSRYASGFGLYNKQGLTPFGRFVLSHDPGLTQVATQWILHYHFSAPQREGPAFWGHLVRTVLQPGNVLTSETVGSLIEQYDLENGGKQLKPDTYRGGGGAFLNTYGKRDGLGALGFLKETGLGEYTVDEPIPAPWPVVAYALADTWAGLWGDRVGVNLDETREVGALLLMGSGTLNTRLRAMATQERGMVEVQRRHPPYQVTRLALDPATVLEHLYERDDDSE